VDVRVNFGVKYDVLRLRTKLGSKLFLRWGCLDGSGFSGLPECVCESSEPPSKTVWRAIFGHQISRRLDLPFRNYSEFNFSLVWLESAYSRGNFVLA